MPTWIRVRDTNTGHEYDLREDAVPATPGVEVVAGYPTNSGPGARPRPAKHRTTKAGRPAGRTSTDAPNGQPADTTAGGTR